MIFYKKEVHSTYNLYKKEVNNTRLNIKKRSIVLVFCLDESYLRCVYLCFQVYCFDKSYLRCFCLCFCSCFKCLNFFHQRKITVSITSISILPNYYTTKTKSTILLLLSLIIIMFIIIDHYYDYHYYFYSYHIFYHLYENKLKI